MLPPQWWKAEVDETLLRALLDRLQEECELSVEQAGSSLCNFMWNQTCNLTVMSAGSIRSFTARAVVWELSRSLAKV